MGRRFGVRLIGKKEVFFFFCVFISPLLGALFPSDCHTCISSMGNLQLNVGNFVVVEQSCWCFFWEWVWGFRGYEDSYCGCLSYNTVLFLSLKIRTVGLSGELVAIYLTTLSNPVWLSKEINLFLRALMKLRKHLLSSPCLFTYTSSAPSGPLFIKFDVVDFY